MASLGDLLNSRRENQKAESPGQAILPSTEDVALIPTAKTFNHLYESPARKGTWLGRLITANIDVDGSGKIDTAEKKALNRLAQNYGAAKLTLGQKETAERGERSVELSQNEITRAPATKAEIEDLIRSTLGNRRMALVCAGVTGVGLVAGAGLMAFSGSVAGAGTLLASAPLLPMLAFGFAAAAGISYLAKMWHQAKEYDVGRVIRAADNNAPVSAHKKQAVEYPDPFRDFFRMLKK